MTGIDGQRCDVEWLGRRLEADDSNRPILVDCRPASQYGASHIGGAVSLAPPALIQRRLLKGNIAMPVALGYCSPDDSGAKVDDDRWKSNLIVLYGDDDDDDMTSQDVTSDDVANGSVTSKFVSVLLKQLKNEGYSVCYLSGGLKQLRAKYPHLCTSRCEGEEEGEEGEAGGLLSKGFRNLKLSTASAPEVQPEETMTSSSSNGRALPVEVLPRLYLGDAKNASDLECLDGNGIRYILNVTPNVPNAFETNEDFRYLQIPIKDHWSQNLTNYFPQAITFIDEGRRLNTGVLVHCLAGISRSVTVTVAYLMYSMSLSLNDAYDYVKQRKPNVSPNLTFMGQLLDFENALKVDRCLLCPSHSSASFSSSSPSSGSPPPPPPPASFSSSSSTSSCSLVPPSDAETGSCRPEAVGSDACALPSTTTTTTETTTT